MLSAEQEIALRARFPGAFGLRGFPGQTFRVSCLHSYIGNAGQLVVYTEVWRNDRWEAFAKGSEDEVRAQMCALAT